MSAPAIERLLQQAHADLAQLNVLRDRFNGFGFSDDQLPNAIQLMAFAVMGDHSRAELIEDIGESIRAFTDKGLLLEAEADATALSTPQLRFLCTICPWLSVAEDLLVRLAAAATTPGTPAAGERIVTAPAALSLSAYGVEEDIEIVVRDVLRVAVLPLVVAGEPEGLPMVGECGAGSTLLRIQVTFPIRAIADRGELILVLMDLQGGLSRHRIPVRVLSPEEALDSFLPRMPDFGLVRP